MLLSLCLVGLIFFLTYPKNNTFSQWEGVDDVKNQSYCKIFPLLWCSLITSTLLIHISKKAIEKVPVQQLFDCINIFCEFLLIIPKTMSVLTFETTNFVFDIYDKAVFTSIMKNKICSDDIYCPCYKVLVTQIHRLNFPFLFLFSVFTGDERSYLAPDRYKCTMISVFYSTGWADWTED